MSVKPEGVFPLLSAGAVSVIMMAALGSAAAPSAMAEMPLAKVPPARQDELLYVLEQDCGSCHGLTLKGGLGSPLLPDNLAGRDVQDVTAIILNGVPGTPMAPWRALLSEGEARWMAEALKAGRLVNKNK